MDHIIQNGHESIGCIATYTFGIGCLDLTAFGNASNIPRIGMSIKNKPKSSPKSVFSKSLFVGDDVRSL
jgi:hypothetical protein